MQEASSSGVEQVIHSFIHGTNDLKALLLQHTDVIFECKSCRSLFRQLKLFVKHKAECNGDIQQGLTFNGADLDYRAGNDLENTLQWTLPILTSPPSPASVEPKAEKIVKTEAIPIPEETPVVTPSVPPSMNVNQNNHSDEERQVEDVIVYGSNCPVCGKSFATKNNCRRHVREMHGMNPISKPRLHAPTTAMQNGSSNATASPMRSQSPAVDRSSPSSQRESCPICNHVRKGA